MSLGIFEVLVIISFKGPVAHDDWGLCIPQLCGCHSIIYICCETICISDRDPLLCR